jgi:phage gpG-like protein
MPISIEAEVSDAINSFHWNESEYERLLHGPIMQEIALRAIKVESSAKQHASGRPGPNVRTGRLRGSITWRPGEDGESPYADVGSNVHYAPYVELGTSRMAAFPFLVPALEAAR